MHVLHLCLYRKLTNSAPKIKLTAKGKTVDAKSILMIMSLGLTQGTELTISAEGDDAQAALDCSYWSHQKQIR